MELSFPVGVRGSRCPVTCGLGDMPDTGPPPCRCPQPELSPLVPQPLSEHHQVPDVVSGLEGPLCGADRFLRLMCLRAGGRPGTTGKYRQENKDQNSEANKTGPRERGAESGQEVGRPPRGSAWGRVGPGQDRAGLGAGPGRRGPACLAWEEFGF